MLFNDAVFAIHKTDKHQRDVIARSTNELAAQMLRIHRDASGQCTSLEAGVDHRLDGVALGF